MRRFFREIFLERFLMRRAERRAASCSADQRGRVRFLLGAARARLRAAAGLRSPQEIAPAFRLMTEAFAILVSAHAAARGELDGERALTPAEAWQRLASLEGPLPKHAALEGLLQSAEPLDADRLSPAEALRLRPELEALLAWLGKELEVRTVRRIKVYRALRLVAVACACLTFLVVTLAWAFAPENIALGKPVRASSRYPRTPDPAGATDGVRGHGYGVHTLPEARPWVELDLGSVRALSEVAVFNRSDGWENEILPLTLELSENGADWLEVATRSELFTAKKPWRVRLDGKRARFLRLIVSKKDKGYIALSEIEVYEK